MTFAPGKELLVKSKVDPGGFIHVHGDLAFHALHGDRDEFVIGDLHSDGIKTGIVQSLLQTHGRKFVIEGKSPDCIKGCVDELAVIHIAHDVENILQQLQSGHLAGRVLMSDADLNDFQLFHTFPLFCSKLFFYYIPQEKINQGGEETFLTKFPLPPSE